jgi:hypothetical protein
MAEWTRLEWLARGSAEEPLPAARGERV